MNLNITVRATSNSKGTPQRIAKGGGKQRTVAVDLGKSSDWNAGNAAGTLAAVLIQGDAARRIAADNFTHTHNDDQSHTFSLSI